MNWKTTFRPQRLGDAAGRDGRRTPLAPRAGAGGAHLAGRGLHHRGGHLRDDRRAAAQDAGPAVILSFAVAALGCALAALCYAEFAAMAPVAGSAYTYAYTTLGEIFAWIIGWDLILEYAMGCATVASAWSGYFNEFLLVVSRRLAGRSPGRCSTIPFTHVEGLDGHPGSICLRCSSWSLVTTILVLESAKAPGPTPRW